jgi:LysM repeat protein
VDDNLTRQNSVPQSTLNAADPFSSNAPQDCARHPFPRDSIGTVHCPDHRAMTIRSITSALALALLAAAAGCGGPPPPPLAPEPEPEEIVEPEPEPEPEIPLEERIRAPFAVQADGRVAVRLPRETNVVAAATPAPQRQTPAATPERPVAPEPAEVDDEADEVPDEPVATAPVRPASARPPATGTPASSGANPRDHTVVVGETFFGIARTYGVTPSALSAVNPGVDAERLRAGQVLRLPAYATRPTGNGRTGNGGTAERAPAEAPPTPTARRTHRVEAGETLWAIARRYGVSMDAIRSANDLDGDTVRLGQTLVIP